MCIFLIKNNFSSYKYSMNCKNNRVLCEKIKKRKNEIQKEVCHTLMSPWPVFISTSSWFVPLELLLLSFTFAPIHIRLLCGGIPSRSQPLNAIFICCICWKFFFVIYNIIKFSIDFNSAQLNASSLVCVCMCVLCIFQNFLSHSNALFT